MRRRHFLGTLACASLTGATLNGVAFGARAGAATMLIVPDLPLGAAGAIARVLQPFLEQALNQELIVDFRPGAGGIVGLTAGARAAADGATITLLSPAVTLAPWLSPHMDCTPADFAPIGQVSFVPAVLAVAASSPYRAVPDLLAEGGRGRGFAVPAATDWAPPQLAQAMFLSHAHLSAHPIAGVATEPEQIAALLAGDIDFAFLSLHHATDPQLSGSLRVLAVSDANRAVGLPDIPTLQEAGIDVRVGAWRTLAVPADTPEEVRQRLSGILEAVLRKESARADLERAGVLPSWLPGTQARRAIMAEYRHAGTLFRSLGLTVRREVARMEPV